ncbi:hypothetical protein RFI_29109 [Reticulomyxa filosa]|uniref:PH domain-containing protein n=1 Tax=Reticulomyxa filosa TaxID=46433 RepID=X6M5H3_RETFI|nr:hypothetical protein RFI_29109 [Reticulomyxa filosa]|eukprot:ETO08280.1 hypothetical protein RFI_29109 [Reticulomyxa filosa]
MTALAGYLKQKGRSRLVTIWKSRYCVLNNDTFLIYKTKEQHVKQEKPTGMILTSRIYSIVVESKKKTQFSFWGNSDYVSEHFIFDCPSAVLCKNWANELKDRVNRKSMTIMKQCAVFKKRSVEIR